MCICITSFDIISVSLSLDLTKICNDNWSICKKHGNPRGFKIRDLENLPVKGIFLGDVSDVTIVAAEAACLGEWNRELKFHIRIGQIDPKWDKSGTF